MSKKFQKCLDRIFRQLFSTLFSSSDSNTIKSENLSLRGGNKTGKISNMFGQGFIDGEVQGLSSSIEFDFPRDRRLPFVHTGAA